MQSFTISEWVKTPPPSTGIIDIFTLANTTQFWGNIEIFFENGSDNSNGKVRIHVFQNGGDHTYSVDGVPNLFNTWVNISVSYDANFFNFQIVRKRQPGKFRHSSNVSGPLSFADVGKIVFGTPQFQTTPSQTSGSNSQPWASFLTGQIDEVRVYNKALTALDIQALVVLQGKGK